MSDHRRYLEYIVSQDPRGQAEQLLRVRNKYRREGEQSLPSARRKLRLNKTRAPIPINIDAGPPQPQPPPIPLPGHVPASGLETELDALAQDLVLSQEITELRRRIADLKARAGQVDAQRLSRFEAFISNRSAVHRIGRETPYWQPMLDELVRIWLAPASQQETLRGELIARRMLLLSGEGQRKLFDALRLNVPDLVHQESYLFQRLLNPNQGSSQSSPTERVPVALPNLDRSRSEKSGGGFRWYHFVMIYFFLKFLFMIVSSFFK